ncbi:prenyltransferase/squalene oxidase repeat-containing protein [Streptomyces boncukensis]|uniref:Terpene cyclase/mutase family protein n=1 Tax=Streptomyces boncukensis TaxID=2711219 RepID=A0A6G4X827_9ACTN|nr:prenyltransferase/squalene oxidase repeat-containing protein [Streptomyces boncukensis]NGO73403.1 terpene cyclase/mutase family protein [Streptomyces boncukensis]
MFPRRSRLAAAAATALVLCAAAAPTASAASPSPSPSPEASTGASPARDGLYGKGDPQYDGVWRQSLTFLALYAADYVPSRFSQDWLLMQQCDDGSFPAYRPRTKADCDPKKTPADVNATAIAVQALTRMRDSGKRVDQALDWLKSVQNDDGGWGYQPGSPSDANSVSVVIGALSAAGRAPSAWKKDGKSPYDALLSLRTGQGAFAYQPGKDGKLAPNYDATAAAVLAGTGRDMTASGGKRAAKGAPAKAAGKGAAYLASVMKKNGGYVRSVTPGAAGKTPDYANTADAVTALSAAGQGDQAEASLDWLAGHLDDWDKARNDPAALSMLLLANKAAGSGDPAKLGGVDLVERIHATGPKPEAPMERAKGASQQEGQDDSDKKDDKGGGGSLPTWSFVLVGLAVGAGVGILLSGRRKRQSL